MTPPPETLAGTRPTEQEWSDYFDTLASAVQHLSAELAAGRDDEPAFPAIAQPASSCPTSLERRRREVADLIESATTDLEQRKSQVASELAGLKPRTPRSPYRTDTGGTLDLLG